MQNHHQFESTIGSRINLERRKLDGLDHSRKHQVHDKNTLILCDLYRNKVIFIAVLD